MFTMYKEPEKLAGSGMDSAGHPGPDSPTATGWASAAPISSGAAPCYHRCAAPGPAMRATAQPWHIATTLKNWRLGDWGGALVKGLTLKSQQNLSFHPIKDDISRIKYRVFNNQNGTVLQQHWV